MRLEEKRYDEDKIKKKIKKNRWDKSRTSGDENKREENEKRFRKKSDKARIEENKDEYLIIKVSVLLLGFLHWFSLSLLW